MPVIIVRLPTIGGSAPFYLFTDVLEVPTFGLSIVNFDNNQHGPNENLRIQNLWGRDRVDGRAVDDEVIAARVAAPRAIGR